MIINNEFKPYQAFFIGTNQHSLMFDIQPVISIMLVKFDEFIQKMDVKIRIKDMAGLPKIGELLPIDEIKGSETKGYTAYVTSGWSWKADLFINQYERLTELKNVGNYQLVHGSNDMRENIEFAKLTGENLKSLREKLSISRPKLAELIAVPERTIKYLENENRLVPQEISDKLVDTFPDLKEKITLQLDWITFNFPELNGEEVINNVLQLKRDLFLDRTTSQNFYTREFAYAGEKAISVQDFASETVQDSGDNADTSKKGASLFMTGVGVRLFETALDEQGITWKQFFNRMYQYRGHATRLDIAINDMVDLLNMDELVDAVQDGRFWSKARSYAVHGSKQFGWTINFGKSPFVIRIYDKKKEQESKGKDTNISTRVELELHGDRATQVIEQWLGSDNLVGTTFGILNQYLWFLDDPVDEEKFKGYRDRENYIDTLKPMTSWALLVAMGTDEDIKFRTDPKEQSIDSIESWISKYVAPSLKVIQETGRWQKLLDTIREIELTDDKKRLVKAVVTDKMSIDKIPTIY